MKKNQQVFIQLAGWIGCFGVGLSMSTQAFAKRMGYDEVLGQPLFEGENAPVYMPWKILEWMNGFYAHMPTAFDEELNYSMGGLLIGAVWAVAFKQFFKTPRTSDSHGSARWATKGDAKELGLLADGQSPEDGVVIGMLGKKLLVHNGKEHIFCFAPTRSGKGVGLVVPTLLNWRGSTMVLDIKGENWALTAGWRKQFSHVLYFNPTDAKSIRYNPLLEVRKGPQEVRDVQNIVEILSDDGTGKQGRDFWTESGKSLLTGLILHVLYAEKDKSLAGVLALLRSPEKSLEDKFLEIQNTKHFQGRPHPVVAQAMASVLNTAENTRAGIVSTVESLLVLFSDEIVAANTRESDFRLKDLQYHKDPISLYLVIPPSDLLRLKPLLRLMLVQLGSALTAELDVQGEHHRLLLMLDEFPVLGRIDWFEAALAYIAGYDIKAFLIAQDLNQIEKAYGANNAILGNTHVRIAYASNDDRTAKRISDLLGQTTIIKKSESFSGKRGVFGLDNRSVSESEFGRPLLTPGEVLQLDPSKELVLLAGAPPLKADKVRYYDHPLFKSRSPGIGGFGQDGFNTSLVAPIGTERLSGVVEHDWINQRSSSRPTYTEEAEAEAEVSLFGDLSIAVQQLKQEDSTRWEQMEEEIG